MSAACHRSLYGYQLRTALALAVENPHVAVTFLPLACTGATIENGLLGPQRARECPPTGALRRARCRRRSRSCRRRCDRARKHRAGAHARSRAADRRRQRHLVFRPRRRRDHRTPAPNARCSARRHDRRSCRRRRGSSTATCRGDFAKLRAALKPLVGGNLSRVVYVTYGHPALAGRRQPCPGGRDWLRRASGLQRRRRRGCERVSDFVANKFLPRMQGARDLRGRAPAAIPATDRMTFVDSHQAEFAKHGFCARADDDPVFDRECFSPRARASRPIRSQAATDPLVCALRPREFRPYAPRARWIRTANDSYFTAMTYPRRHCLDAAAERHPRRDLGRDRARSMAAPSIRPPRAMPRWRTRRCRAVARRARPQAPPERSAPSRCRRRRRRARPRTCADAIGVSHAELLLQARRRRRVLEDELLVREDVAVRLLRHQRGLVEAAQDELELARIGS